MEAPEGFSSQGSNIITDTTRTHIINTGPGRVGQHFPRVKEVDMHLGLLRTEAQLPDEAGQHEEVDIFQQNHGFVNTLPQP